MSTKHKLMQVYLAISRQSNLIWSPTQATKHREDGLTTFSIFLRLFSECPRHSSELVKKSVNNRP